MPLPTSEPAKRLHALFNRRPATHWDVKEILKFRQLVKNGAFSDPTDLALIERYTLIERKKGIERGFHRRNLITLLNNWHSELDKAREWEKEHPIKKPPRKIVPVSFRRAPEPYSAPTDPEEIARIQRFEAELSERKRARGELL